MRVAALSIAGSDSGGGAGIQADLNTMSALGVFGTTALSVVTAQNLTGVRAVHALPASLVRSQVEAVLSEFPVGAIKTGMLWSRELVEAVALELSGCNLPLVVDPVMVASSGDLLLQKDALQAYADKLIPQATLLTPNLDEAKVLLKRTSDIEVGDLSAVAIGLHAHFGCSILLKGGHLKGNPVDLLVSDAQVIAFSHPRIHGVNTHGSGCMLSAAIAACLALDCDLVDAVHHALSFLHRALELGAMRKAPLNLAHLHPAPQVPLNLISKTIL